MKFNFKSVCLGFVSGVLVMGSIPAIAKTMEQTIKVAYKNIRVFVDGQEVNTAGSEPFIYNGTTYLPIRKVGEAFGKAATWNGNTNTVYLGSQPGNESCIFDIMQPYASDDHYRQYYGNDSFDYAGSERKNGFTLGDNYGFLGHADAFVTFNLDGKYNGLTFECQSPVGVEVYLDDVTYQEIKTDDSPVKISIPLNGVLQVKLKGYGGFWNVKLY